MSPQVIFVDVDDTMVRSVGSKRIPIPGVVSKVREWHAAGHQLFCWSSGGAEYARNSAQELNIAGCFSAFLPKPHVYVDDQAVEDWRQCRHIYPSGVMTDLS